MCSHFFLTPALLRGPVFLQASTILGLFFFLSPSVSKDSASYFQRQTLLDFE